MMGTLVVKGVKNNHLDLIAVHIAVPLNENHSHENHFILGKNFTWVGLVLEIEFSFGF